MCGWIILDISWQSVPWIFDAVDTGDSKCFLMDARKLANSISEERSCTLDDEMKISCQYDGV